MHANGAEPSADDDLRLFSGSDPTAGVAYPDFALAYQVPAQTTVGTGYEHALIEPEVQLAQFPVFYDPSFEG